MPEFADLRLKAGLSVEQAADFLEVSVRTAYRYERKETKPRPRDLRALKGLIAADIRPDVQSEEAFRFIDLFAGIGGLRIGFEAIGGECVFTSEWDKYAQATYRANFPKDDEERHTFAGDIREVTHDKKSLDRIPQHDVLLAGFPCQPFSIAGVTKKNSLGRPHGFMCDTQGTLFYDVAKIIAHHRPAVFALENVKNLERHDKGKTFGTILHTLQAELGYHIDFKVISSEPWVPQKRERIFIVGFRQPTAFSFEDFRSPSLPGPRLGTILEPEADVPEKYVLTEHLWNYLRAYKEKHTSLGNGFGYSVFGPDDVTRTLSARYFKDGSEVLVDRGPGRRPRRLTPKECARLMGFYRKDGSDWFIPVSDTQAYKQFGNAVVVPVVRAVAEHMQPHILEALAQDSTPLLRSGNKDIVLPAYG